MPNLFQVLTEEYPTVPDYPPDGPRGRWAKRLLVGSAVLIPVLLVGGFVLAAFGLSGARLGRDRSALAGVETDAFGGEVESASATGPNGEAIPIAVGADGKLVPKQKLHPGEEVHLEVVVKRPSAVGWVAGETNTLELTMRTPKAKPVASYITVAKHSKAPKVHFSEPVMEVSYGTEGELVHRRFRRPHRSVSLGEQPAAGSVLVAAAARDWEHVGKFETVTWFPAAGSAAVAATPPAGSEVSPSTPLTLVFSKPVKKVLGGAMPSLDPEVPGKWKTVDAHTLSFTPSGFGAPMATDLEAKLPHEVEVVQADGSTAKAEAVSWHVPAGSELRLQQMLAQLGYMPTGFKADKGEEVALTPEAEVRAATEPPAGSFTWKFKPPSSLKALWNPGEAEVITQGALMAFQDQQGLEVDGVAGPEVWRELMEAAIAGERKAAAGYNYVVVSETLPESVKVFHNGKVVEESAANTGVPGAETEHGTFPVFLRYEETTMRGENPDGSHYVDPGIMWVSYFNGGDALHAFDRASYGTPQSVGCVEMPLENAAAIWPLTPIGTLVTVGD